MKPRTVLPTYGRLLRRVLIAMSVMLLAACGGDSPSATATTSAPATQKYTIAASVIGLSGSGLVLQLNGANNLAISSGAPATFATTLMSGDIYVVTVLTQPSSPQQFCSVALGSETGEVNGANVTIPVTCSAATYSVSATVTGLTGVDLALELQVNGVGAATVNDIPQNGPVGFGMLSSGAVYNVAVQQQPTLPAQTCVVTNGSGTIGTANVTDILVTCGPPVPCTGPAANTGNPATPMAYAVISNGATSAVMGYPANSVGTVCPTVLITPANSGESWQGVATDSSGLVYVGSNTASPAGNATQGAILVFAGVPGGTSTPLRSIALPGPVAAIATDAAGNIYVSLAVANVPMVFGFAPGTSGNAVPIRTIVGAGGTKMAVDGNGNVITANGESGVISVYGAEQSGAAMPLRTISVGGPMVGEIIGLSLDPSGNIYVATAPERFSTYPVSILEFAGGIATGAESPISSISGAALPGNTNVSDISLDAAGNLYVLEANAEANGNPASLLRFAAGTGGFTSPTSESLLTLPNAIFLLNGFIIH